MECKSPEECIEDCVVCGSEPGTPCDHCMSASGCPLLEVSA